MVFRGRILAALAVPLLALSGCTTSTLKPTAGDQLLRGALIESAGEYWFESCLGGERQPVVAMPDTLRENHAQQSLGEDWPVYIEGLGRTEAGGIVLTQGLQAGGTQRACRFGLPGVELRAVSEDEQVIFDLMEDQVRVQFVDRLLMLAFERPEVEVDGAVRRWQQEMQGSGKTRHSLWLEVHPQSCSGKRGDWYGLSMEAELSGRYFKGCARFGDLVHWPLRQRYNTPDSMQTRRIDLALLADGGVRWREDYMNDQPLLEYEGRWIRLAPNRLQVRLGEPSDTQAPQVPLVFSIAEGGALHMQGFHPAYGRALTFESGGGPLRYESGELDWWSDR